MVRPGGYILVSTPCATWRNPHYGVLRAVCPPEEALMAEWGHVRRGYEERELGEMFGAAPERRASFINGLTALYHDVAFSRLGRRARKLAYLAAAPAVATGYLLHSADAPGSEIAAAWRRRMDGGWLFGYVAALARQERRALIAYASERVRAPRRLTHAGTGAAIWLVPGRRTGLGRARASPGLQALQQWRGTPWREFDHLLSQEGCSAVLVQDYEHPRFDALALIARRRRLPLYATFQGGDVTASALERRVRGLSLRICSGLIVPSARERTRLAKAYRLPAKRLCDIPNPVDVSAWRAEPAEQARAEVALRAIRFSSRGMAALTSIARASTCFSMLGERSKPVSRRRICC